MRLSIWIATALGLMVATAQVVVPPQGGSKKLTFLIALPYELNDSSGDLVNDIANSYRMMMSGMHIAAKVAERDVLMTYGIPDGLIDFVYINTWDPEFGGLDTYSLVDSGGYSANAVYEAIQSYNVIGIVGEILSRTTRFSAGVASYFQKPFCGATQGSVTLSEKKNYPYFFRQMSAKGTGKHFVAVLRYYGMKTLCVFRSTDDLSFSVAEEIKEAALKVGLNVVTVSFGEDVFRTNDSACNFNSPTSTLSFHFRVNGLGDHQRCLRRWNQKWSGWT
ncbi:hypothetical protein BC829DRAFT_203176 [Chytridium lagenaria]|nr:hypothetical protein BC829DRAFT_203176 [Chytridium lagenaria]